MFSFVIPVFATEEYLPRCLDSLVAQTDGDFEVVIVDDCSPGDCHAIVARYDGRFRYIRQDRNRSSYQARARAISEACGEYVVALDPDDYVLPDLVSELKARAMGADIVSYNLEMDMNGVITPHWCQYAAEDCDLAQVIGMLMTRKMQWNLCGKAIRREICRRAMSKSHDSNVYINASDDFAAFFPMMMESERFRFLSYSGYRYWQNATSTTHSSGSLCKTLRAATQTWRARRLVLKYLSHVRADVKAEECAKFIAHSIVDWLLREYVRKMIGVMR